jgi:cytochrome c
MSPRAAAWLAVLAVAAAAGAVGVRCRDVSRRRRGAESITGGNIERGRDALHDRGCAACHTIPGVRGANGTVGPSLESLGGRSYLAGRWPNTPENLARWVREPQHLDPGHAMPDMGVTEAEARDIAAYLYSQP